MIEKLALGTVQFGLDYGINNQSGQVPPSEVEQIIAICRQAGIITLDTAYAYGESERVLGKIGISDFRLISKLPPCDVKDVKNIVQESLERLNLKSIDSYMLHNFSIYKKDKTIWDILKAIKEAQKIKKIGFSLYSPQELETLWKDGVEPDLIQIPYNLFDRRFEPYLQTIKERKIEIHTRSVFLQGLFFKTTQNLPKHFHKVGSKIAFIEKFLQENQLSVVEICLGFVLRNPYVDKLVLGVDSKHQLLKNISVIKRINMLNIDWKELEILEEQSTDIVNPSQWKL